MHSRHRRPRRSMTGNRRSVLIAALLSLAILLPALPLQFATASQQAEQPASFRAQDTAIEPLVAFLRQGNLWLMNADGSDARQITDFPEGITRYAWSPSGRYMLIQHGGGFWHYTMWRDGDPPEASIALYDITTSELRDLVAASTDGMSSIGRFPSWAQNADELLMEVAEGNASYSIKRVGLDGTISPVSSYTQRQPCGGPDGPMTITRDLLWEQELGSPFAREAYRSIVWWTDRDVAYINPECGTGVALDLVTGTMTEYPSTVWLAGSPDGRILTQDSALVGGESAGIFDPVTGATTPIDPGEVFAWGATGEIVSTTVTEGAESAFTSVFDDLPSRYLDNTVGIWRADGNGGNRQLIVEFDVFGTGIPSVSDDGTIIVGAVDNPTALLDIDTSQYSEYSPRVYADHQKVLRIDSTGEVTVLATNAYRPRPQPAGSPTPEAPAATGEPANSTETPTEAVTPTQDASTGAADYPFAVPIVPYVCEQRPDEGETAPGRTELPEGCTLAANATFMVTGTDGEVYGNCTTPPGGGLCSVGAPAETDLLVTLDETTLPAGYIPVENPVPTRLRGVPNDADGARFVILPVDVAGEQPVATPETSAAETTGNDGPQIEPASDWIAYVGDDGNIWLMQPDGSQQTQITTDGTMENGLPTYTMPAWSPDGTVLVFHKTGSPDEGIVVYRDGTLTPVPNTARCGPAAVTLDNSRLLYSCASGGAPYQTDPTVDQLSTDPNLAAIASSNLDGTDARVLVPYALPNSGQNAITWVDSGLVGFNSLDGLAVNSSTGEILATFGLLHSQTAWLVEPGGDLVLTDIPFSDSNQDRLGPFTAEFLPGSEQVVALVCEQGCYPDYDDQVRSILILNRDGSIAQRLIGSDTVPGLADFTVSPDATTLMFATYDTGGDATSMLWSMPIGEGATPLHPGSSPAWQPNPDVAVQPAAAAGSAQTPASVDTPPTESTASGAPDESRAVVPNEFIATWSGRGVQVNPSVDWPITITITGGAAGEIIGTTDYPEDGCTGNLILSEVTDSTIVTTEQLTSGQDFCADNGTIILGPLTGPTLAFTWEGIGSTGTASSATGSLTRADSTTTAPAPAGGGSASQSAARSDEGPVIDTTQLHSYYIGTFSGTGTQKDPDSEWPITVTFTGGRPGEVIGTVEYPTLGCGGELILVSINPNDEWLGFKATERITYGHDTCIDGGTFVFSSESAVGITFGWTSPVSATSASGNLPETEPGAVTAPVVAESATGGDEIDSFIGTWEGTGTQSNRDNSWPISFIITGGQEGEIVGTVDYPTLDCGGELIFVTSLPWSHVAPGIELTERITYGESNCIDGGTFELRLAEGGGVPSFQWVSPDGTITARGPIDRVDPNAASAPDTAAVSGESPAMASADETEQQADQAQEGGGGPPSIYDPPAGTEPVPIEPEGEGG